MTDINDNNNYRLGARTHDMPLPLRHPTISLGQFRRALKTHLFLNRVRRLVTSAFIRLINVLTYLLTYLLTYQLQPIHALRLRRPSRLASSRSSRGRHEYSWCTRQTDVKQTDVRRHTASSPMPRLLGAEYNNNNSRFNGNKDTNISTATGMIVSIMIFANILIIIILLLYLSLISFIV